MNIQGIGQVSALGRGIESFQTVLKTGRIDPSRIDVPFQEALFPVYAVARQTLKDPALLRGARRADRFSKMAVLAACDAVSHSGVPFDRPERVGLIIGTAFGPHPTVFRFLDEILEFGDAAVSPTLFSHSVHNAAASYVSSALGLTGPAMTLTTFFDPFQQSLLLAQSWLDQGVCDSVLVGGVEECGAVMEYVVSQKLDIAEEAMVSFFAEETPSVIPGEGAFFFMLGREPAGPVGVELTLASDSLPDLWIADFESSSVPRSAPVGCWSHLAGAMPVSSAVSCFAAISIFSTDNDYSQTSWMDVRAGHPHQIGCIRNESAIYLKHHGV